MLSLSRHGNMGTTTYGLVDNLTLTYRGNQLLKVKDTGVNPTLSMSMDFKDGTDQATEYFYDANGNMVKDLNKGITGIEYNALNLPRRISFSGANHPVNEYVYSSDGQKLSVTHTSTVSKVTDYVGSMIYENGSLKMVLVDGGYYDPSSDKYYFYLTDHLGNNRVVADASGNVIQATHYYPYGISFAESTNPTKQPFKYNAKELDSESGLNLYDYVARGMDPALGRFMSMDPMAEKYYSVSPYLYCNNNPLKYIDPDGNDYVLTIDKENSKVIISAVYYASTNDLSSAQQAVDYWNSQSGNFAFETKEGDYTIEFSLSVVEVETDASMSADQITGVLSQASQADKSGMGNVYQVMNDSKFDNNVNGRTSQGNYIRIRSSKADADTGAHEIGHTLGLIHSPSGLMTPSATDSNRSENLNLDGLGDAITYPVRGRVNSENGNDAGKGTIFYFNSSYSVGKSYYSFPRRGKIKR